MNHSRIMRHHRCTVPVSGTDDTKCGLTAIAENIDGDGMWRWLCWWHSQTAISGGAQRLKLLNEAGTIVTVLNTNALTDFHDALEAVGAL